MTRVIQAFTALECMRWIENAALRTAHHRCFRTARRKRLSIVKTVGDRLPARVDIAECLELRVDPRLTGNVASEYSSQARFHQRRKTNATSARNILSRIFTLSHWTSGNRRL